ncbi:DoxX protein [bacterium A37T11]|nr:DoxX protein [bacterium A37T11]
MTQTTVHKPSYLVHFARILTGVLFIFSGLIKANDPTGFSYKLIEYFEVFHLTFFNHLALALAVLICTLEILLGALLLLGFWGSKVAWGLLILILFFSFLTFYSAYFEVVTSCGCFGDAIPLTPWQSFSKDLVLLILIVIIFANRRYITPVIADGYTQAITAGLLTIVSLGIGIYTVNFLPFIDFLPYKVGNNLPKLMTLPPGEKPDEYEMTYQLLNKETGQKKQLTDKEYIAQQVWLDKSWEIQGEPTSRLVKKGYTVPIGDLQITDAQGGDHTHELIENPDYNLIVVAWDLDNTDIEGLKKINAIAAEATDQYRIRTVLLTGASAQDAEALSQDLNLSMENFYADGVPLKMMVRANPGVLLLKNGNVVDKWHFHTFPSFDELSKKYFENAGD